MISRTHLFIVVSFFSTLSIPFLYATKGYFTDPLNLFGGNSRTIYQDLNKDGRMRAAVVLRNASYNSLILGSSMLLRLNENQLSVGRLKYVNVSTLGSTIHERLSYLKFALDKKRLQSVVFSMDHGLSLHRRDFPINMDPTSWMYLFDKYTINDLKIYFSQEYFSCVIGVPLFPCGIRRMSSKKSDDWYQGQVLKNSEIAGINGWKAKGGRWKNISSRASRIIKNKPFVKDDTTDYVSDLFELRRVASENKKTEFVLIVPPYSMLYLKLMYENNNRMFSEYREFISNIYHIFQGVGNVRLIYIDGHLSTGDLQEYIDLRHYKFGGNVVREMVSYIESDSNHLNENFAVRFTELENILSDYNYTGFIEAYKKGVKK